MKIASVVNILKKEKNVLAVYIFGSRVSGKITPLSDVDVCVIGDITGKDQIEIASKFSEEFDISFFSSLPIWIKMNVIKNGECLFAKNEKALNLIKLFTLNEYLDFKPVIEDVIKMELSA